MNLKLKLADLGLSLPPAARVVADYVPVARAGDVLLVSGQLPWQDGKLSAIGSVPTAVSLEHAQQAAAYCVLNGLSAVDAFVGGDWSRFDRILRLGVFVASDKGFREQHLVANGASSLLVKLLGEQGKHARAAVGVAELPLGAAVEVELMLGWKG
jgi:enamine deaminase RidA (YjgF/YER057c/UK114 family)